ncbi:MAG: hypothetical protein HIU91_07395 [Acidobacteria bacterium]|nr:hypothetical protein [Acidobacteriota bacterium]
MTSTSLLHFFEALCWAVIVFLAIAGWGTAALRLLRVPKPSLPLAAIAGFSIFVFLGGCLNLTQGISPAARLALIAVGVVCFLLIRPTLVPARVDTQHPSTPRSSWTRPVLFLAACVFLIRFGASVHTSYYQHDDDYNFYLAAPVKMAALHAYAADPFSERRVMSSLGGNYFLQTLILSELPVEDIQMADRAFGLLLVVFVAVGLGAVFRLNPLQRALLILFLLLTPQLQFNLTFVVLPYALFCGLVFLASDLDELESRRTLQALLLGAAAATIASFKSTYLPHGVLFFVFIALLHARRRGISAGLRTLVFASLGCLIVLLPWMIASHAASGTWFYPLLGKGYQYSAYGLFPSPSGGNSLKTIVKVMIFNMPLLAVLLVEWFWCEPDERTRVLAALTSAALVASVLVGLATGGDSVRRYNYPAILSAILLLYLAAAHWYNLHPTLRPRLLEAASAVLCVCLAMYIGFNSWTHEYQATLLCLRDSLTDFHIVPSATVRSYADMEAAIPQGPDHTLATVDYPFLLNFRSRSINIADIPGAASLPPGWPSRSDGNALAAYLLAHHLRYLALSFTPSTMSDVETREVTELANPSTTQWIKSEAQIRLASYRQYNQLIQTRRHLYDADDLIVLDLQQPTR